MIKIIGISSSPVKKGLPSFQPSLLLSAVLFCAFLLQTFFTLIPDCQALSPQNIIIVYNRNVAASGSVARYYAEKRGVPVSLLLGVDVPSNEDFTWEDYEREMIPPLKKRDAFIKGTGIGTSYSANIRPPSPNSGGQI